MFGPVLTGDRVRLGPPPSGFAEIALPWLTEAGVARFILPYPPSLEQEREWLDRVSRSETTVMWAVWVGEEPIGTISIFDIDWRNRRGETGTLIGVAEHRGRGYGSEAMALRTRYAFEELGFEKLVTHARADNTRSIGALKRTGYRDVGLYRHHVFHEGRWHDVWLGELLREDWEAARRPH